MQIIVSDTSCIIDLKLGALLGACFRLPYQFVMPTELFESELLSLNAEEKRYLISLGLEIADLDSDQMTLVYEHRQSNRRLTVRDCYALTLAQTTEDAILLTGDANLRTCSERLDIETHGVFWALDRLLEYDCCTAKEGMYALTTWKESSGVFLPEDELHARILTLTTCG